jgi:hypothetical protein
MQTFVPYADFQKSAKVLDYRRLGKQRVETLQLVRCNLEVSLGWKNHPAAKMWANNINGLIAYGVAMCDAWLDLGYKDTCRDKLLSYGEAVHSSHRSNLLRKDLAFYSQWGWTDDPAAPYIWPEIVSA